jgi:hypothetical protein
VTLRKIIFTAVLVTGRFGYLPLFMALSAFLVGVIFIRSLTRRVVRQLEEIDTVIIVHRNGDTMRRCTGENLSQDVVAVFTGINGLIDQCQALAAETNRLAEFN